MSQGRVSDNSSDQMDPGFLYDVYTFNKDPETKLSPWQKFCTHEEVLAAQKKAHQLHKSNLYERIEILQRCPVNSNKSCKTIKVYRKQDLLKSPMARFFFMVMVGVIASFLLTHFFF